jgi:5-methylcytosine-specific restriction endonuclease McrA
MKLGQRAEYITAGQWKSKVLAFGYKCVYCKKQQTTEERLTFDHLVPIGRGGGHFLANLVPACMKCNNEKGAKLLEEWKPDHALSKPRPRSLWDANGSYVEFEAQPAELPYSY